MRSVGDVANIHQLLDAAERLVVFLAMHPERAASTGQGLGLAVAVGAIKSRRRKSAKKFPPILEARLSSFENALDTVLSSIQTSPQQAKLKVQLMRPQLWPFLPASSPLPSPRHSVNEVRTERRTSSEDDDADDNPGNNPEAVLLELRALLPCYPPTSAQSDACLAELMIDAHCSRRCVSLATSATQSWGRPPASGYALTHRLLFLLVARQVGCMEMPHLNGENTVRRLCSLMLNEAENISLLGYPELLKDIFVEQVTLCGLAGYREFLRPSWKSTLLDWQRPSGCFGNWSAEMISLEPFRSLAGTRVDGDLGGGCLAHLTDVATGALGVFLAQFL